MKSNDAIKQDPPIACIPSGVPADTRKRWLETGTRVYDSVIEVKELPNGYSLLLPNDQEMILTTAEYISLDRLCCAFVNWRIELESSGGPMWLHVTGGDGAKEYFRNGFETTTLLKEEVARAAGFNTSQRKAWNIPENLIPSMR